MTPKFLTLAMRRMEMPPRADGKGFGMEKIRYFVLHMLSLRCILDIQV